MTWKIYDEQGIFTRRPSIPLWGKSVITPSDMGVCYTFSEGMGLPQDYGPTKSDITSQISTTWEAGPYGWCVDMDGTNSQNGVYLASGSKGWDMLDYTGGDDMVIFLRYYLTDISNSPVIIGNGGWQTDGWYIQIQNTGAGVMTYGHSNGTVSQYATATGRFTTGHWGTLAISMYTVGGAPYNAWWIDGNIQASGALNGSAAFPTTSARYFVIGKYPLINTLQANMKIAEFRCYRVGDSGAKVLNGTWEAPFKLMAGYG